MSHFTTLVVVSGDVRPEAMQRKLNEVLAPYDENMTVPARREYIRGNPEDYWSVDDLRESGKLPKDGPLVWKQVVDAHNEEWGSDDGEKLFMAEDGARPYRLTTYNPESKWDWWVVGGRWSGYFRTKKGADVADLINYHHDGSADGGRKRAIDFEGMLEKAENEARTRYQAYREAVKGTPEAIPWQTFADNVTDIGDYTIQDARREYFSQPRMEKLRGTDFGRWISIDPIEEFSVSEDAYAGRARASAIPGYALVNLDGEWSAPGEMGWFGMHDDEQSDREMYQKKVLEYLVSLDEDTWLIQLDLHI